MHSDLKLSNRLSARMAALGFTQSSLSRELNTSQSTIARWLGGSKPQPRILKELANVLCVRMQWLTEGAEPMELDDIRTALAKNGKGHRVSDLREQEVPYNVRSRIDAEALVQNEISQVREAISLHDEIMRRLLAIITMPEGRDSPAMQTISRRIDEWRDLCGSLTPRAAQTLKDELAHRNESH